MVAWAHKAQEQQTSGSELQNCESVGLIFIFSEPEGLYENVDIQYVSKIENCGAVIPQSVNYIIHLI